VPSSISGAGEWEVVHCWCALHDLLLDVYAESLALQQQQHPPPPQQSQMEGWEGSSDSGSAAYVPQPPPSLRAFLARMVGAETE